MTKRFSFFIIMALFVVVACNNGSKNEADKTKNDTAKITVLTFEKKADSLINKPVIIEGTVFHICKHGGKKMFLVDGTDSIRVEITAGPAITKFDESLIGSRVKVAGMLKEERIDAKYLNEWEAELKKPVENHTVGIHSGAKGHEDEGIQEKLDQINGFREQIKASGKDHLSFFSIEASSYTALK
ncbi:MAG: hypothetical protein PHF97_03015 [Bacteroidales bacterium]|nr:OB-fold nucleic acid binding domain-containing protein [Bacteroidales bacterium]MDD4602764.1 hypothetical protein [Bacteroidales bacterium]